MYQQLWVGGDSSNFKESQESNHMQREILEKSKHLSELFVIKSIMQVVVYHSFVLHATILKNFTTKGATVKG